jgi:hypothetical protein
VWLRAGDHLHQPPVAPGIALQDLQQHPVRDLEARLERLGRPLAQPLEGALVPVDEPLLGRLAQDHLLGLPLGLLLLQPLVLDHVLGRLRHHPAAIVEALAAGAPADLLELAHREDARLLAVVLAELGEEHGSNGDVDPHAERVGPRHHLEEPGLRQLLHQEAVLGQESRVVQADARPHEPAELLSVGRVERHPFELG